MKTLKKFTWFMPWNDEKEEEKLARMSGQGWHLKLGKTMIEKAASGPSKPEHVTGIPEAALLHLLPGRYLFEQGKPLEYSYRLDFFTGRGETANYLQLFADAGWEYVGALKGWQYFRKERKGENPEEIYTDNSSKVKKYQQNLIFQCIWTITLICFAILFGGIIQVQIPLIAFILTAFAYSTIRLLMRIKQLQRSI